MGLMNQWWLWWWWGLCGARRANQRLSSIFDDVCNSHKEACGYVGGIAIDPKHLVNKTRLVLVTLVPKRVKGNSFTYFLPPSPNSQEDFCSFAAYMSVCVFHPSIRPRCCIFDFYVNPWPGVGGCWCGVFEAARAGTAGAVGGLIELLG